MRNLETDQILLLTRTCDYTKQQMLPFCECKVEIGGIFPNNKRLLHSLTRAVSYNS